MSAVVERRTEVTKIVFGNQTRYKCTCTRYLRASEGEAVACACGAVWLKSGEDFQHLGVDGP